MKNSVIAENVTKIFNFNKKQGIYNLLKNFPSRNQPENFLKALDDVSFSVPRGEVLGLIGLNGSGKTTLLRVIAGLYQPDLGSIHVNGKLSPLLQIGVGFQGELSARENIIMNGMLLGVSKAVMKEKVDSIIEYAELRKFSNTKIKLFSAGMRARLAFATIFHIDTDIILLDEILAVGDTIFRKKSHDAILSFMKSGKTVLVASHNMKMISEISHRVLLLDQGQIVKIGKPNEVISTYQELARNKKNSKNRGIGG